MNKKRLAVYTIAGIIIFCLFVAAGYYIGSLFDKEANPQIIVKERPLSNTSDYSIGGSATGSLSSASNTFKTILKSGESFTTVANTNAIFSPNGRFSLSLESSGELCVRQGGLRVWRTWNFAAVQETDLNKAQLEPILTVNDKGVSIRDKSGKPLFDLLSDGFAKALNCKVSHIRVTDAGVFQVIADQLSTSLPLYHSPNRILPNKQIILWASDPEILNAWHVSSGVKIDSKTVLGCKSDNVLGIFDNRMRIFNAHPQLFTESSMSTNLGVRMEGKPILLSPLDSFNISCDYMQISQEQENGYSFINFYEKGQIRYSHPIPQYTFYVTMTPEGVLLSHGQNGTQEIWHAETTGRHLIKPESGSSFTEIRLPFELAHPTLPYYAIIHEDCSIDLFIRSAAQGVVVKTKTISSLAPGTPASNEIAFVIFGEFRWAFFKSEYPGELTAKDVFAIAAYDHLPIDLEYAPGDYITVNNSKQPDRLKTVSPTDIKQIYFDQEQERERTLRVWDVELDKKGEVRMRLAFAIFDIRSFPESLAISDSGNLVILQGSTIAKTL